jgi:PTH1 family peptidyl-tRNA hydrolase
VLGRFRPAERAVIEDAITLAVQAASVWMRQGIEVCMNRFNAGPAKESGGRAKDNQ